MNAEVVHATSITVDYEFNVLNSNALVPLNIYQQYPISSLPAQKIQQIVVIRLFTVMKSFGCYRVEKLLFNVVLIILSAFSRDF